MPLINNIWLAYHRKRLSKFRDYSRFPDQIQTEQYRGLINEAKNTVFGKNFGFYSGLTESEFKNNVPVHSYETLFPYIERVLKGEKNVTWPGEIRWFAKSSGTTNARSKFLPVTKNSLNSCHIQGGRDLITLYLYNHPDTGIFRGKGLVIGGSHQLNQFSQSSRSHYGDLSAVLLSNLPFWSLWKKTPPQKIALLSDWEHKMHLMVKATVKENVTSIFGVPTWTVVLIQRILEKTGAKSIREVWPNLEVFFHGAVSFTPYQELFSELIPGNGMHYFETYNASEGLFGIQHTLNSKDLLLMLDYGIYYEFLPFEQLKEENPVTIGLAEVEIGKNYAMIISTNAGLWRYKIGDTIKFTSLNPYRIRITGRTKHFINAFGEELIIENAEQGISMACKMTGAIIGDFTAAPRYMGSSHKGTHEWIIEFKKHPDNLDNFIDILDNTMRKINSDYDAKRQKDIALQRPIIHPVREGTFYYWMKKRDKLGGQNKVPRLANSREYIDDILSMIGNENQSG